MEEGKGRSGSFQNVRVSSTRRSPAFGGEVTISGLTENEVDALVGMVRGFQRVGMEDGRLQAWPIREPLPDPIADEAMLPFWRRASPGSENLQLRLFAYDAFPTGASPSLVIQSLCGYDYTPQKYREQAAILESYGFEWLRSRRGLDGGYWELWYLPDVSLAKGGLQEEVQAAKTTAEARGVRDWEKVIRAQTDAAVTHLCRTVSFGSLDVTFQRAAMPVPD
jgi:hypothetical protein